MLAQQRRMRFHRRNLTSGWHNEKKFWGLWGHLLLNLWQWICDVICENPSHVAKLIFWVIGIMRKFELFSFQNVLLGSPLILESKVTDVQRPQKIKKNIRIMMLISFILQFHLLRHVTGFHRSHHKCSVYMPLGLIHSYFIFSVQNRVLKAKVCEKLDYAVPFLHSDIEINS